MGGFELGFVLLYYSLFVEYAQPYTVDSQVHAISTPPPGGVKSSYILPLIHFVCLFVRPFVCFALLHSLIVEFYPCCARTTLCLVEVGELNPEERRQYELTMRRSAGR